MYSCMYRYGMMLGKFEVTAVVALEERVEKGNSGDRPQSGVGRFYGNR